MGTYRTQRRVPWQSLDKSPSRTSGELERNRCGRYSPAAFRQTRCLSRRQPADTKRTHQKRHARRLATYPAPPDNPICSRNCVASDRPCTRVTRGNLHGKEGVGSASAPGRSDRPARPRRFAIGGYGGRSDVSSHVRTRSSRCTSGEKPCKRRLSAETRVHAGNRRSWIAPRRSPVRVRLAP